MNLLTGRFWMWEGSGARVALAVFVVLGVALLAVGAATPRRRARTAQGLRIQYAIRDRVDPGPDLRDKVDRYARIGAGNGWVAWLMLIPGAFLLDGRWNRPLLATPVALALLAAVVAGMLAFRRQTAFRDPPGAVARLPSGPLPRPPLPGTGLDRRTSGRRSSPAGAWRTGCTRRPSPASNMLNRPQQNGSPSPAARSPSRNGCP